MRAWNSYSDDLTLKDGSVVKEWTITFRTTEHEVYKRIEKFFQRLIDESNCSEKPNNCETCRFDDKYGEESICSDCSRHYSDCYEPKTESQSNILLDAMAKAFGIEDEPQTDEEYINNLPWTEAGNGEQTDNLKAVIDLQKHFGKPKANMTEDDAFYIVYKDLTKDEGLFTGRYDAKHGSRQYMHGVSSVMEYIAYKVGEDCLDAFNEHFVRNLIESEEKAERSE